MNESYYSGSELYREVLSKIKGIGESTINTIMSEYGFFINDLHYILNGVKYQNSMDIKLIKVRFTGVRNKELVDYLNANGYDAGEGSVTKDTDILIVPYEGYKEGSKYKKAIQYGITIKPIDKFINELGINIGGY